MNRILVVRGGAIGDFVLTLPALKALRDAWPRAEVEILGYKHIAVLAEGRFYANSVRSIEYAALSPFFAAGAELPAEWAAHFSNFDLIISYLYDPDETFATNLQRCGRKRFVQGPSRIGKSGHAAQQLAQPVEALGIAVSDLAARVFPSIDDRKFADQLLADLPRPSVAIHPGSGSQQKNWAIENWIALGNDLLDGSRPAAASSSAPSSRFGGASLIVISGEADQAEAHSLKQEWKKNPNVVFAENLPLPRLAALLAQTMFLGHDSGISHLAAASGANCILLFGPTDPAVWAPLNANAQVLRAATSRMEDIDLASVLQAVRGLIGGPASVPS